jgi:hypothetical protein
MNLNTIRVNWPMTEHLVSQSIELLFNILLSYLGWGLKMKCRSLDCAHKVRVIKRNYIRHMAAHGEFVCHLSANTWQPMGSSFATYQQTHDNPWGVRLPPISKHITAPGKFVCHLSANTSQPLGSLFATYQQTHHSPWRVCLG